MYLLYADESGAIGNPTEEYFILAGVAVFERDTHWIDRDLNEIAARFNNEEPQALPYKATPTGLSCGEPARRPPRFLSVQDVFISIRNSLMRCRRVRG